MNAREFFGITPVMELPLVSDASEWVIPLVLPRGVTMLSAEAKAGKTWFATGIALAVSDGIPFGGVFPAAVEGPVLHLIGEGSPATLRVRAQAHCQALGIQPNGYEVAQRSFELSMVGDRAAKSLKYLHEYVAEEKPALVILDPARRFFQGDENSSEIVSEFMRQCMKICRAHEDEEGRIQTSVLLLHHTGIGGTRARGSGDWDAGPDCVLYGRNDLERHKECETAIHVDGIGRAVAGIMPYTLRVHRSPLRTDLVMDPETARQARVEWRRLYNEDLRSVAVHVEGLQLRLLDAVKDAGGSLGLSELRQVTQSAPDKVRDALRALCNCGALREREVDNDLVYEAR